MRTPDGERVVGTPNCSSLTIRLDAHAQRHSLQLRADARLIGGNAVIEHWSWEFPEFPDNATIELVSEPAAGPAVRYDPPDASHTPRVAVLPDGRAQSLAEIEAVESELKALEVELEAVAGARPSSIHCAFCGKNQHEVRKLVEGQGAFICDECVRIASDILAE